MQATGAAAAAVNDALGRPRAPITPRQFHECARHAEVGFRGAWALTLKGHHKPKWAAASAVGQSEPFVTGPRLREGIP